MNRAALGGRTAPAAAAAWRAFPATATGGGCEAMMKSAGERVGGACPGWGPRTAVSQAAGRRRTRSDGRCCCCCCCSWCRIAYLASAAGIYMYTVHLHNVYTGPHRVNGDLIDAWRWQLADSRRTVQVCIMFFCHVKKHLTFTVMLVKKVLIRSPPTPRLAWQ